MNAPGAREVLLFVTMISAVSVVVTSLEAISNRTLFKDKGLLSWRIQRIRFRNSLVRSFGDVVLNDRAVPILFAIRGLGGGILILSVITQALLSVSVCAVVAVAVTTDLLSLRDGYGGDGADQMMLLTFSAAAVALLRNTELVVYAALAFISLQALLSYVTAAIAKLFSDRWGTGRALVGIMSTHAYGWPTLHRFLMNHQPTARMAEWSVVVFQLLLPIGVIAGGHYLLAALLGGAIFHVMTAIVMRLHSFTWAFVAAYPAIFWLRTTGLTQLVDAMSKAN